ncbi:hypothetical protein PybrP1_008266 [[Pythium] brassicae (nom. inval.)]|nr:hypothetical protein PybrP1_008266 [[Pythium] brassicae (nom. inval.)]
MLKIDTTSPYEYRLTGSAAFDYEHVVSATASDEDCMRWCMTNGSLASDMLASYLLELCVLVLILLNVVLAISESSAFIETPEPVIFSIEYVLRLWSCVEDERYRGAYTGRLAWMVQPLSVLDLVALMPFYLEICFQFMLIPSYTGALILRSLRLLRIISFLRLERSYNALKNLRVVFGRKQEELLVVSYLTMVVVLTSSTTIFFLENSAQPSVFSSIGACAWWSIETITSLGYGDIVPKTGAGRVFGSALAIWGIVLFTIPGAVLGSGFIEVMLEKQQNAEEDEYSRGSPVTLMVKQLALKLDAVAVAQERFQEQLCAQKSQLAEVVALLHALAADRRQAAPDASAMSSPSKDSEPHDLVLDRFCLRQFDDPKYLGTQIRFDKAAFVQKVNEIYLARNKELVDGYAPFCKHLFIENFTDTRANVVEITQSNSRILQSGYEARAENELPVLVRWFPSHSVTPVVAKYLDVILYSREQIEKENEATGHPVNVEQAHAPWGIISVKAQDVAHELPMNPITIMRNALGKEEGGSGVPLDRAEYLKSVEYWKNHALVK